MSSTSTQFKWKGRSDKLEANISIAQVTTDSTIYDPAQATTLSIVLFTLDGRIELASMIAVYETRKLLKQVRDNTFISNLEKILLEQMQRVAQEQKEFIDYVH